MATLNEVWLQRADHVTAGAFVIARDGRDDWRWWTWAGAKANHTPAPWAPDQLFDVLELLAAR
ncbi:hypothetical protein [Rhodococcus sp. NPDC003348]